MPSGALQKIFTVDAFSKDPFSGNPAAVCVVERERHISDGLMKSIASEMNLSETAFVQELDAAATAKTGSRFGLRWFTPTNEVDLCGHATLASAHVLFHCYGNQNETLEFETRSGVLKAQRRGDAITIDLPLATITHQAPDVSLTLCRAVGDLLQNCAREEITLIYSSNTKKLLIRIPDYLSREHLERIPIPNGDTLLALHDGSLIKGIIVTLKAPVGSCDSDGNPYDFFSRYFAPWNGIPEDPVTGSAHCVLGNYWAQELSKISLYARQCSKRGGDVIVKVDYENERVYLGGASCVVLSGEIHL